ncbi:MAG: class B sortase [Christensenellaceae bacterium]|nr:class B sortase [Christensenellaceae bacterium]
MNEKTKKIIIILIIALLVVVFALSAYMLASYFIETKKADLSYKKIYEKHVETETNKNEYQDSSVSDIKIDFESIPVKNGRSTSWIMIKNTVINYPVVQGSDNDYYLTRLPDGTKNKSGSIFMDYRNADDFSDPNTFIYGHHMKNGSMFAAVTNYADQSFYEEHPYIFIITPDEIYRGEIFSAYVTPDTGKSFKIDFNSDKDFDNYLQMVAGLSDIYTAVEVGPSDNIITLSTCTYEYDNARFLVHAKLVNISEEEN